MIVHPQLHDEIKATNLSKSFNKRIIVRDVSINIRQGEVVGLFGPNGAGKTTCFNMILGLVKPDKGKIFINNLNVTYSPIYLRAKMGLSYLPQEASVFRGLSVSDNIRAIAQIFAKDKEATDHKTEELLAEFSITHLRNASSMGLSGGERRRLEIARSLASNPRFIMLDEPLAGIDPVAVADIKYLISHLKDRNIGILITDHNVRDMLEMVDRAYVIYDGKVLIEGTPQEIIDSSDAKELYLGKTFKYTT